ncbi:MAG: alpha/beta hydrolase [Gemmatimonadota bacterium]|nr:alpha/beta hydrolase [Gemmatimonadota bacterium]
MQRLRRVLKGLILLLLFTTVAIVAAFGWGRHTTPPIEDSAGNPLPGSVASLEPVVIGGTEQWVLLRGHDVANPVILFLHGGPGMPAMYLAHDFQRGLERDFVIVHWDRRGAGKSYEAGADSTVLTMSRTLEETAELTEWLRNRFGKERIYLVGHSWGSKLGMLAVRERPDLYAAFVGTGQMAADLDRVREYRRSPLLEAARSAGDQELVGRLESGEPSTEDDLLRHGVELRGARSFWPILWTGLRAPEYGLIDALNVGRGASRVARLMKDDVLSGPLDREVKAVSVPVFFLLGRHDLNTPSEQAADYLSELDAPLKELVWFDESAHFPFWTESERFHREMRTIARVTSDYWSSQGPSDSDR